MGITKERFMKQIAIDTGLVAKCGLYCGACPYYLKEKCGGCEQNKKAEKWCKVRTCNLQNGAANCARCKIDTVETCKVYNNPVARFFSFVFRSNRKACIERIRAVGEETFAREMAAMGRPTLRR
jgi:hypothetical protein